VKDHQVDDHHSRLQAVEGEPATAATKNSKIPDKTKRAIVKETDVQSIAKAKHRKSTMAASKWMLSNHSHKQTPSRHKGSHLKETDVQSTAKIKNQSQQWQSASGSPSNHSHMQEQASAFLPHVQRTKNCQSECTKQLINARAYRCHFAIQPEN